MRKLLSVLFLLLTAGCLGDDGSSGGSASDADDEDEAGDNSTAPSGTPPAAIHAEGNLVGAQGQFFCDDPAGLNCAEHPFTLDGTFVMDAILEGVLPTSDYDLYLYDGTGQELASSVNGAGSADQLTETLEAGSYILLVTAFEDPGTGYVLDATFTAP